LVELVWDKKYDGAGRKASPVSVALPFQTIETLNESSQQRQKSIESFLSGRGQTEWRNRLIWGDKKYVLPGLLSEFANSVDLIYIDPPFDTGADFSYLVEVPDHQVDATSFTKLPSVIEQKAYRDTWGVGETHLDSYLHWFYDTVVFLVKLLKPTGSIYVHLDWHVSHYAKGVLDEVLGRDNFRNEIIWRRTYAHNDPNRYGNNCDFLLFYTRSENYTWNQPFSAFDSSYVDSHYTRIDESGRRYRLVTLDAPAHGRPPNYAWKGVWPPKGRMWALTKDKMEELERQGRIEYTRNKIPNRRYFLDEMKGVPCQSLWTDIFPVNSQAIESVGYVTQKPEALLERIIKSSSSKGDIVLDCFVGSGTSAAVAERLGRRWVACDLSRFAIHTTRKRLLNMQGVRPFVMQNLGKFERQAWQTTEVGEEGAARIRADMSFILKLYSAQPLNGYVWLHGTKGKRLVHVGSVDSPVSPLDVGQIVAEFKRSIGTGIDAPKTNGVDVLAWDFAFELNELAKQQAAQANVDVRFLRIPREVLDRRAVEQGDVHFFELASLDVGVEISGMKAAVAIKDFVIPADDVPAEVQKEIKHWSQWIDYWAVDWDYKNDTFHNEWQEYRTDDKPNLAIEASKTYVKKGEYRVVVKVIDILGNDTTKMLLVRVS